MIWYHPAIAMTGISQSAASAEGSPALELLAAELFDRSGGARLGLARAEFVRVLAEIARKYLSADASWPEVEKLWTGLRLEELALARACAAGHEAAWQEFLLRFREKLYDAALGIAREESVGRELADTLYADLYGTVVRDGKRISKLSFYTGRGSLEGWLRTVLAQEYVNRYRHQRRLVSLEEKTEAGEQFASPQSSPVQTVDSRLEEATDEALQRLGGEDRFVLAAYFLDGRTLAEIARMLGVHESTISRKVEKIAAALRKQIREGLMSRGMSRRQAEEALQTDVRDVQVNVRARLAQDAKGPAFSKQESAPRGD